MAMSLYPSQGSGRSSATPAPCSGTWPPRSSEHSDKSKTFVKVQYGAVYYPVPADCTVKCLPCRLHLGQRRSPGDPALGVQY